MEQKLKTLSFPAAHSGPATLTSIKVKAGDQVRNGTLLATYSLQEAEGDQGGETVQTFKSSLVGKILSVLHEEGDLLQPSEAVFEVEEVCAHSIVVFDMCADCGLNLRRRFASPKSSSQPVSASVSMIHGIPELRVSQEEAEQLGNRDRQRLLNSRKLALIVDLDQTLVHTSMDPNIEPGLPDVYGFRLPDHRLLYHCRLRPHTRQFLDKVSKLYELHVFTMGTKSYAASVTRILDPEGKLFCDRIISRDECFDPRSKALRLKSVFPCGDSMVAIIDDREDVWGRSPNLIHVKPYMFFTGTADINAPPPSSRPHPKRVEGPHPTQVHPPSHVKFRRGGTRQRSKYHMAQQNGRGAIGQAGICITQSDTTVPAEGAVPRLPTTEESPSNCRVDVQEVSSIVGHGSNAPPEETTGVPSSPAEIVLHSMESESDGVGTDAPVTTEAASSVIPLSSDLNNNNNNSNNNNTNNEEDGNSGSSGSSSDSDSSSSSSGIDDSLFDMTPGDGGSLSNEGVAGAGREEGNGESHVGVSSETVEEGSPDQPLGGGTILETAIIGGARPVQEIPSSSPDDKRKGREIQDPDDFLIHLADILQRIHQIFYETMSQDMDTATDIPDLKEIIPELRLSILKDCRILFTGVIPTNIPARKNQEWNTARAFGATIHTRLVPGLNSSKEVDVLSATTHVIAGKPGTTKLLEARRLPGVKIVNPRWLWACAERWKKVDEALFPAQFENRKRGSSGHSNTEAKRLSASSKEDGDSDMKETDNDYNTGSKVPEVEPEQDNSDSDSSEDDIFKKSTYAEMAKMDTADLKRHLSMDSHLSVSDEELERMDAEVDAEISSSEEGSAEGEREGLGSHVEDFGDNEDNLSYEKFAGTHASQDIDVLERLSRKRKFIDVETSSSSGSVTPRQLNDSFVSDNDGGEEDSDEEDELGALLGF